MRHFRLGVGLVATACALGFGAAPALAHEFTASREGKLTGSTEEVSKLKLGAFKIKCLKAGTTGKVAAGATKTIATATKLKNCSTEGKIGNHPIELRTSFLTPIAIEYHAGGAVEVGSELEEEEGETVLAGGEVELKVSAGSKFKCLIRWPTQTLPKKAEKEIEGEFKMASYLDQTRPKTTSKAFPDGLQHYVLIENTLKFIHFTMEGEPCEEWGKEEGPEGAAGTYTSNIPTILNYGNLEFF